MIIRNFFSLPIVYCLLPVIYCLLPVEYIAAQTFTIIPVITNATCPDDSNGAASVSVSGGSPPYTYLWNPGGQTTSAITALSPKTYSVTISDNGGNDSIISLGISNCFDSLFSIL